MKLYHGTNASSAYNIFTQGVDLSKSMKYLDFGEGFYTTNDKNKAIARAKKKTADYNRRNHVNEKPCIVEIKIDENKLSELSVKKFDSADREWCEFITNNRLDLQFLEEHDITNHNRDKKYDVVCGEIADGAVAQVAANIRSGECDVTKADYSRYYTDNGKSYGYQVSFHTEKSTQVIEDITYNIILDTEKLRNRKKKR